MALRSALDAWLVDTDGPTKLVIVLKSARRPNKQGGRLGLERLQGRERACVTVSDGALYLLVESGGWMGFIIHAGCRALPRGLASLSGLSHLRLSAAAFRMPQLSSPPGPSGASGPGAAFCNRHQAGGPGGG